MQETPNAPAAPLSFVAQLQRFRKSGLPPRRVVLWHAFAAVPLALVVLLGGYLSYHYRVQATAGRVQIENSRAILDQVHALELAVKDASVAQRNFLITGDDRDLALYQAGLVQIVPSFGRLKQLLERRTDQEERLVVLGTGVLEKCATLQATAELRRSKDFEAVRAALAAENAAGGTDPVRRGAAAIIAAENQELAQRQATQLGREREILLVGICMVGLSVGTRLSLAWCLWRMRKKGQASPFDPLTQKS